MISCGDGTGVVLSVGNGVDCASDGDGVGDGVGLSEGGSRRPRSDVMSGRSRKPPKPSSE